MAKEKESCGNCLFSQSELFDSKDESRGMVHFCRRYPPQRSYNTETVNSGFAGIKLNWWCGEWKTKVKK